MGSNEMQKLIERLCESADANTFGEAKIDADDLLKTVGILKTQAAEIAKYKSLCDQMGDALNGLAISMDLRLDDDDLSQDPKEAFFALEAWRAMK